MRIAFDVSPLSHPLLGIGNYIQGSLGGLAEAAAGEHEIVAFAPTSIRGPERIRAALAGMSVEVRTWPLPFSHAVRTAWSRLRRPAYSPESGWMKPDSSGKNRLISGRATSSVTRPPPPSLSTPPSTIGRW